MESLSFVAPQAYFLELLMLWSDKSRVMTSARASVLGMVAGSLAPGRCEAGRSGWRAFATPGTDQSPAGGALMGFSVACSRSLHHRPGNIGAFHARARSFLAFFAIRRPAPR